MFLWLSELYPSCPLCDNSADCTCCDSYDTHCRDNCQKSNWTLVERCFRGKPCGFAIGAKNSGRRRVKGIALRQRQCQHRRWPGLRGRGGHPEAAAAKPRPTAGGWRAVDGLVLGGDWWHHRRGTRRAGLHGRRRRGDDRDGQLLRVRWEKAGLLHGDRDRTTIELHLDRFAVVDRRAGRSIDVQLCRGTQLVGQPDPRLGPDGDAGGARLRIAEQPGHPGRGEGHVRTRSGGSGAGHRQSGERTYDSHRCQSFEHVSTPGEGVSGHSV